MSKYFIRNKLVSLDWILIFSYVDILDFFFRVGVKNLVDVKKVKCYGFGIELMGVKIGVLVIFIVDIIEVGEVLLEVICID